jgi:hypothetical protein
MDVTRDGNMASARVGELWLVATGTAAIADDTWREYLEYSAASVTRDGPFYGILFWSPNHGPSTRQRKMLTEEFAHAVRLDDQRSAAVISASGFVRGTITAINWFTRKKMAAFGPENLGRALDWLADDVAFDRVHAERALGELADRVHGRVPRSGASAG